MRSLLSSCLIAICASSTPTYATEVGISGPSVWYGDVNTAVAAANAVAATGAAWARVNMRLDVWTAPDDMTLRGPQKLTYFQAYDRIVDTLVTHGVQVYALINAESVPGGGEPDSDDFVNRYTDAAVKIIDHFKDRVRIYEIFNEPNNWRDSKSKRPLIAPYYLAELLQKIYLTAKHDGGRDQDPCDQVTIVSGGLFSSQDTDATAYLQQVYQAGRSQLAWDWMHANVGTYPLDAVGYHVYVGQSSSATTSTIQAAASKNLSAIEAMVDSLDPGTQRSLWVTEMGWTTDQVSAQQQADFLTAGFATMNGDPRVSAAFWFTYQDFPNGHFGIYASSGFSPSDRHPLVYAAFTQAAQSYLPVHNATFVADDLPMTVSPGETRMIMVQVKNLGALDWSEAGKVRLGAGPGCPSSAGRNQLPLVAGAAGGYEHAVTDARLFLDGNADVANGATATFSFSITAPADPGTYTVALRMVQDGVAWFGDSFTRALTVVPTQAGSPGSDPMGTVGSPAAMPGSGGAAEGGCALVGHGHPSGPLTVGIFLLLLLVAAKRRSA
jgi:hypothetical protein